MYLESTNIGEAFPGWCLNNTKWTNQNGNTEGSYKIFSKIIKMSTIKPVRSQSTKIKDIDINWLKYLAGFMDGDGKFLVQIKRANDHILKFKISVSFSIYQKTVRYHGLLKLHEVIGGNAPIVNTNGMSYITNASLPSVKKFIKMIQPHLIFKSSLANLILNIIEDLENGIRSRKHFIEVCKKVDKVAELTDSKLRVITTETILKEWESQGIALDETPLGKADGIILEEKIEKY